MNVMLVSQCSKRALKETRRILDQFAERRGERSWQTAITLEGIKTLHRLLRKTARKNTAVACFWIRGHNHSELIWIVGDAGQFNERGATPTNASARDVLRHEDENDWHTGEVIRLLGAIAGLMHDLGKANIAFQEKLTGKKPVADVYRHEWVSLRLFQALVRSAKDDHEWLKRLQSLDETMARELLNDVAADGLGQPPLKAMPPLARVIGWLIVSHHRLPMKPEKKDGISKNAFRAFPDTLKARWCGERVQRKDEKDEDFQRLKTQCWQFHKGSAFDSAHWREHAKRLAEKLLSLKRLHEQDWLDNPYVIHLTRMGLMLADHYYSSQNSLSRYGDRDFPLHANTGKDGQLKQRLDEHLIGVEVNAGRLLRQLPRLDRQVSRIARHKGFTRRSRDRRFAWQDKAYDLAASIRERAARQGFFGINMASTGTGKTLANGRILYGLADPMRGARFNIALGLRTLTLQTGDAYRERLGLGDEDMAVLVGGGAIRELHEKQKQEAAPSARGSESAESLLDESSFVHYEGGLEDGPLAKWLKKSPDAQKLLAAPILISTIDHLMPATESTRGGHQIAPMLRLLTSDLVLDEPDDFDLNDLPALTRLVNWAGMLGCRVLLSSATLPPALLQGLYEAYRAGREVYQRNRGEPSQSVNICCAWFDEFGSRAEDCPNASAFQKAHQRFVGKRLKRLAKARQKRRAMILPVEIPANAPREEVHVSWARILRDTAESLHDHHHSTDPATSKRLSCGLIRMAHIEDIIATARALLALGANEGRRIHLCVYHSRHPLLMRAAIEEKLDRLLKRHETAHLFKEPEIRAMLDGHEEPNQIFVVLASPVAEVGRDHDYDWAIVEPSSFRSIIQLAGRVRRHRDAPSDESPNINLLKTNLKHLFTGGRCPAFCRPGFETELSGARHNEPVLASHDLNDLIADEQLAHIDASARIQEREPLDPRHNLADLEHAQLRALMGLERDPAIPSCLPVTLWHQTRAHLSGELQRKQPFRDDPIRHQRYYLDLDEDNQLVFQRFEKHGTSTDHSGRLVLESIDCADRIGLFDTPNYAASLEDLAERMGLDTQGCARKFGVIDLPENRDQEQLWCYHPALGFWKHK